MKSITGNFIVHYAVAVFVAYFLFMSFVRHDNFYSRRLDLGNMDQTVWNVAHGNGFTLTDPMGESNQSRLAVHADFLLILLAPLYYIWSDPKMLLLVQVLVVAAGAYPVYWIASDILKRKQLASLFPVFYLFYPPLQRIMLHDFHAVALSAPLLLYAFWFMTKKKYFAFGVFSILAGLGKEQVWLTIALFGLYIAFVQKHRRIGLGVAASGFLMFYVLLWHAIPGARVDNRHFALAYLSEFGDSQGAVVRNLLLQPWSVITKLFLHDRIYYYYQLLAPLGFLPLLSPVYLMFALPSLLINSLSSNGLMRDISYQYNSTIIPFLMISSIYGLRVLFALINSWFGKKKSTMVRFAAISVLILLFCATSVAWGNLPWGRRSWFKTFITKPVELPLLQKTARGIGTDYSVSVTNNIGAHFTQREHVYNFPIKAEEADFSVVYLGDPYAWPSARAQEDAIERLVANPQYESIAQYGKLYVFRRKQL